MPEDTSGKTEKPTAKKLKDGRREGQFARTPDAATWVGIAAGASVLPKTAQLTSDRCAHLLSVLPAVGADPSAAQALRVLAEIPLIILVAVAPVCIAAALGGLIATAAQGVHPSGKALKPKFSRMSPKQGIKRMFGTRAVWEGLKALLKVLVIATVVIVMGRSLVSEMLGSGPQSLSVTIARARDGFTTTLWAAVIAGLLLAMADYGYQRHTVMKQLRMSPRDIRDEMKQSEGDPMMKGAIRSRQFAMSRNRMLSAVVEADVVLVNPTHLAVAVKYQAGQGAPRVIAKGAGAMAVKMRERAREARVPVVEDKPLARALHRVCEVGEEIPTELYLAVATILAFVMAAGKPSHKASTRRPSSTTRVPDLPSKGALRSRRAGEVRIARQSRQGDRDESVRQ